MDINTILQTPSMQECKKVLCVQPHPDDNEIGMGGIIASLTQKGCEIHYLTVTDGRLGNSGASYTPDQLAEMRQQEVETAGRLLGVKKFFYLHHHDGMLNDIPALAREVGELIRQEQYDTVFCPDPWLAYEAHYDHVITGKAVAQAAISCSLKMYPEGTQTTPSELTGVGFYFTASPNTVVDTTAYFDRKFEAIAKHETQMNEEILAVYRDYFSFRGKQLSGSTNIAEGLKMLRPLHLHCFPEAQEL